MLLHKEVKDLPIVVLKRLLILFNLLELLLDFVWHCEMFTSDDLADVFV